MSTIGIPDFDLRFPLDEVGVWARRYDYADDAGVVAIGERAAHRRYFLRDEFLAVMLWKAKGRIQHLCAENTASAVEHATRLALATTDEHQRVRALTQLSGVAFPTASVLLHLAHGDRYPVLDYRALWSLGVDPPPAYYSFEFWEAYTHACRSLADEAGVSMRTLDRALWQYSKDRQPAKGSG